MLRTESFRDSSTRERWQFMKQSTQIWISSIEVGNEHWWRISLGVLIWSPECSSSFEVSHPEPFLLYLCILLEENKKRPLGVYGIPQGHPVQFVTVGTLYI